MTFDDKGNTSVHVLLFLIFLAALFLGAAVYIGQAMLSEEIVKNRFEIKKGFRDKAGEVIELLGADQTPENNTFAELEDLRSAIEDIADGYTISIEDVSSKINPNWVRQSVFETGLKSLLQPGVTGKDISALRIDQKFAFDLNLTIYEDVFADDTEKYFTPYGYMNITMCEFVVMEEIYARKTDNEAEAKAFYNKINGDLNANRAKIIDDTELNKYLGASEDKVFPLINTQAMMNVFFVDELIFKELMSMKFISGTGTTGQFNSINNINQYVESILGTRETADWTEVDFQNMIPIQQPAQKKVFEYFGVITWFWKIVVEKGDKGLEIILARIPEASGPGASGSSSANPKAVEYKIIEEKYYFSK